MPSAVDATTSHSSAPHARAEGGSNEAGFFTPDQRRTVAAAMARIIPTDATPGAAEAGTINFVDRYLSGTGFIYAKPDGSGFETLTGRSEQAWRSRVDVMRGKYAEGVRELDSRSQQRYGADFADLESSRQDEVLRAIEGREGMPDTALSPAYALGGPSASGPALQQTSTEVELDFLPLLVAHTRQGFYADPIYGGTAIMSAGRSSASPARSRWPKYTAAVTPPSTGSPRVTPIRRTRSGRRIMASKGNPERTDVCIIGAGASGATAAKVLTEAGVRVVALERGPWRRRESFGGDELANINRYNLWPDPLLNPRTARTSAGEAARQELFCPVPQMVGGGTVHWQGWLPRFTPNDFRLRSVAGELPGTTLADWPVGYDELEPYYDRVEWAFGVSGLAGANRFEGPRSRGYPCQPMPMSRYAEKFHKGCAALGWNSFPTPQAALSQPFGGRPATVVSAFAQQHGDPTGTRSSALNVFIPDAVASGRYDLRPGCIVRELTLDSAGQVKSAIYEDADGNVLEQEADVFLLACGAVETARRLLLSKSGRFPNGLANGSDLVGRNVTFHEYSAAVGVFDDPVYAWAGGGYVSASSFQFYEHDARRGFVGGGHIAAAGVGIPLPINWRLPGSPAWGAEAKRVDREAFNHSMAVAMVLHDMPQHDNRIDLDDAVVDAWGLPVARVTLKPHQNDLDQGRFLIDRSAEILEGAKARSVTKVYAERVTGNCSHQHGTARMGTDPAASVLNRWCQAHEVDNLFAVDGSSFPTATGANPTLTIMANAWRVADHIVERRGRFAAARPMAARVPA